MGAKHRPRITVPDDPATRAYLAGLIDADGNISVGVTTTAKGQLHPSYSVMVQLTNTDLRIMEWLLEIVGGAVHSAKRSDKWRRIYVWKVYGKNAEVLLRALEPHLRIKRDRASVALELRSLVAEGEDLANQREALRQKLLLLNAKGERP